MRLIHEATIKQPSGLIEIDVIIINKTSKRYTYLLASEFLARKFEHLYKKKSLHGKALALLNKSKEEGYDVPR